MVIIAVTRLITLLLITCAVQIYGRVPEKKLVHIGGFFPSNNLQKDAFEAAVEYFKHDDDSYLRRFQLISEVIDCDDIDSFEIGNKVCAMMSEFGVAAIFGPQSHTLQPIVKSTTQTFGIPNFLVNMETSSKRNTLYQLNLHPHYDDLAKAMVDAIALYEWKSFAIVYENEESIIRLQELLKSRQSEYPKITMMKLSELDYRITFKELKESQTTQIVLDCSTDHVLDILRNAHQVRMMDEYIHYFITSLDAYLLDYSEFMALTNISFFSLVDPETEEVQNGISLIPGLDVSQLTTEAALTYDAVHAFVHGFDKLDIEFENITMKTLSCEEGGIWESGPDLSDYIKHIEFQGMTGPVKFDEQGRRADFTVHLLQASSEGKTKQLGMWNPKDKITNLRSSREAEEDIDKIIQGKTFRVASKLVNPHLATKKECKNISNHEIGNSCLEGYAIDLIDAIAKAANFGGYEFYLVADGQHGKEDAVTKKWNGIIRDVMDRDADLGICDMTINVDRAKVVDFTTPFMNLGIQILLMTPPKAENVWYSFMQPFDLEVWLYIATGFLGVTITLFIAARLCPDEWVNPNPIDKEPEELENSLNLINCLWFSIGTLLCQGCDILPRAKSTRMLGAFFGFFCLLIMNASYTANLAAFLTSSRKESTINSAEDLSKQTKVKYGHMKGGATANFFENTENPVYQKLHAAMQQFGDLVYTSGNDAGVKKVLADKGLYAFFMESVSIDYEKERQCDLASVGGLLDNKGYGIAMPSGSRYRTKINKALLDLQENGTMHQLYEKWWKEPDGCSTRTKEDQGDSLSMSNVGGVFMVLLAGCFGALLVSFVELLWNCRKIAVEEKVTPWEAITSELKFVFTLSKSKKPVQLTRSRFL